MMLSEHLLLVRMPHETGTDKNKRRKDKNSLLIIAEVEVKTVCLKADFQKCT